MSYGQLFSVHFILYKQETPNGVFSLQQRAMPAKPSLKAKVSLKTSQAQPLSSHPARLGAFFKRTESKNKQH
jgi:hypothetical protein